VCEPGPYCGCDSDRDCGVCETCNAGVCQPSTIGGPCSGLADLDDVDGGICCTGTTGALICVLAESCDCDQFCGPVGTGPNSGSFYCCTEPDYTICCDGPESECCGGPAGRQCDANGHCCEAATPHYCPGDQSCCATPCDVDGACTEVPICIPEGQFCSSTNGVACCEGLSCCGDICCSAANCCENGAVCCGLNCNRCDANDHCVLDCRVGNCRCIEGETCDQQTGECVTACLPTGRNCTRNTDCCSGVCINGLCADSCSPNGGVCDDATDCCQGGTCFGFGVCLAPPCLIFSWCNCIDPSVQDLTCIDNTDCCSGQCVNGHCVS